MIPKYLQQIDYKEHALKSAATSEVTEDSDENVFQ
jgi:hypothetical protein